MSPRCMNGWHGMPASWTRCRKNPAARRAWLANSASDAASSPAVRALAKWYGEAAAAKIMYAEAFELCEYGSRPNPAETPLFPFFPAPPRSGAVPVLSAGAQ